MTGFSYNGIHSSMFGLYYIPNADDKWFGDPEYDVYDIDISWKHGGYYFDSKVKNRTFSIKCYFEEIDIATRQRIKQWVGRGTNGRLVFDDMPFVYWNVRPGKIPVGNWYLDTGESHSGTVTITFTAYEPFGYLTRKSNGHYEIDDGANAYCNLISIDDMPADPTTSSTAFDIYNPGTEECGLTIDLAGTTSNPIRFFNELNGTFCVFESLPSNSLHVRIDGDTGFVATYMSGSTTYENGFAYHDKGVVRLSPNMGYSNMAFTYGGLNGNTYTIIPDDIQIDTKLIGANITIDGVSDTTFTVVGGNINENKLFCRKVGSGVPPQTGTCLLIQNNHILIQEKVGNTWTTPSTLSLSSIETEYNPRIS